MDKKLLDVRAFNEAIKKSTYVKQTANAEVNGISNCPLYAISDNANKIKFGNLPTWIQIM